MKTTIELFYKIVPLFKIFLNHKKGKGNSGIGESILLLLAGRWGLVCLTFLWEDLISFAVKEEKCASFEKDTLFDKHGSGDGRPCVKRWGEDFFMIGIQKDGFTRGSAGLPPNFLIQRAAQNRYNIICCYTSETSSFNDSLLLGHNSSATVRIPTCSTSLSSSRHTEPFLKVVFCWWWWVGVLLRFTFLGGGFVLASKRRLKWGEKKISECWGMNELERSIN